jgi:hypothetical protein
MEHTFITPNMSESEIAMSAYRPPRTRPTISKLIISEGSMNIPPRLLVR